MSRIAGAVSISGPPSSSLIERLIGQLARPSWRRHRVENGIAALAATSWRAPVAAQRREMLVAIDGTFLNREELPAAPNDAERLLILLDRQSFADALAKLNGDFAIAFWDGTRETLCLARDRLGLKPLYFVERPDLLAFASQPRALLNLPGMPKQPYVPFVARFAASHYRTFDNETGRSPYEAVRQLPAGTLLEFRNGTVRTQQWWALHEEPEFTLPTEQLSANYLALLLDSVALRVKAAERPAFTLSGGLDSSSVLSCAVSITGAKQHAFSSIYVDRSFDELDEIKPMLVDKVSEWHAVEIGNEIDLFAIVRDMVDVHDEPVATATWLSHFLLTRRAAGDGFGALFGGMGGDELNAGEYEYFTFHFADLVRKGDMTALEHEIAKWSAHHDHPVFRKDRGIALTDIARLTDPMRTGVNLPDLKRLARYLRTLNPDFFDLVHWTPTMDHPFGSHLKNRTYQDIFRETAPCCLRAEDRHCTAANLERFDPFFDYRLVEFMFRIPGTAKIHDGTTKMLLRAAMRRLLPEETRTRIKKTGWNAPSHIWFTGANLAAVRDLVASRQFRDRGIYVLPEVERIIEEHVEIVERGLATENHAMFLWQLVNLEVWLQAVERI